MKQHFSLHGDKWIPTKQIDSMWEFFKAVDWTEHWLIGLIVFHTATFLCVICTRKYTNFQIVLFLLLLGLAFASEQINTLGAQHWRTFAKEQYFDSAGLFITVVYSGPILLNCFVLTYCGCCCCCYLVHSISSLKLNSTLSGKWLYNVLSSVFCPLDRIYCLFLLVLLGNETLLLYFKVSWLWTAWKMMIVVKRGQLKELKKKEREEKKSQ
ncbi:hypothetical protein pdam_00006844 [Pocillopora damicornis]|uniref:Uncharacterized protein n=1 Tax=Pocillopora damicornis TaxID=46731 RepID=A0A3M6TPC0_POCDA|nr:hypothetical protein pdam_00006844 [Pocillopora damicornis]